MAKFTYIDDIYIDFHEILLGLYNLVQSQDLMASSSFYNLVMSDLPVTEPQSRFMLKLMEKYKNAVITPNFDYRPHLANPVWKHPFRILDDTKRIYVEVDENNNRWVCLKHPYALKDKFNKEVMVTDRVDGAVWDPTERVRKFPVDTLNFVLLQTFISNNGFIIDESFLEYSAVVEEIWQRSDDFLPHCVVDNNQVFLKNANLSTVNFFNSHKTNNLNDDLLLAKSLNYKLEISKKPENLVEKIASHAETKFWITDVEKFFDVYKATTGHVCVIVDDNSEPKTWIEKFIETAQKNAVNSEEIRVCFRERNDEDPAFNQWVKTNNLGGPIDSARLLIFKNKPPKWLFKDDIDVKIIVVNKPFPPSSMITQSWISNHSCVIYIDKLKPSITKEKNIVDL